MPKLVCSTLRPTQLPYTELYDLPAAAQFVADFVSYEPLEDAVVRGCWVLLDAMPGWLGARHGCGTLLGMARTARQHSVFRR